MDTPARRPSRYTAKAWRRAEILVVEEGKTLEQAAKRVGIPLGTLKPRAAKGQWVELRLGVKEYKSNAKLLKAKAMLAALKSPTKDNISSLIMLERAYPNDDGGGAARLERTFETFEHFTLWLQTQSSTDEWLDELDRVVTQYIATLDS